MSVLVDSPRGAAGARVLILETLVTRSFESDPVLPAANTLLARRVARGRFQQVVCSLVFQMRQNVDGKRPVHGLGLCPLRASRGASRLLAGHHMLVDLCIGRRDCTETDGRRRGGCSACILIRTDRS